MAFKPYVLFAVTLLIKTTFSQYVANAVDAGVATNGLNWQSNGLAGYGVASNAGTGLNSQSNGGQFVVTSSSPIAPTGLSVFAENLRMEGPLAVEGSLPLSGTVALEGQVPTAGMAGVKYGCGNGNIGIEGLASAGSAGQSYGASLGQAGGVGYGAVQAGGVGYGVGQAGGLGYAAGQAGGLGYAAGQSSGLGYSSLSGVGQTGLGLGTAGLRVY